MSKCRLEYYAVLLIICANIHLTVFSQEISDNASCMECHGVQDQTAEIAGRKTSIFVDIEKFNATIHQDLSCIDCHSDISEFPHTEKLEKVDCSECHDEVIEDLAVSVHPSNSEEAPGCSDCHGHAHNILSSDDPDSIANHKNNLTICSKCHDNNDMQNETNIPDSAVKTYSNTVHGKANLLNEESKAASCVDCHGYHKILHSENPESLVHPSMVEKTCAKCHQEISEIYEKSVHGKTVKKGLDDAATCTSCHGEHNILSTDDTASKLSHKRVSYLCGKCHFDLTIMDKYGLSSASQETLFKGSVHAEEVVKGNPDAPTCINCHGYHDTLALSDPASPSNFMHVPETCGQCHKTEKEQYLQSVHGVSAMQGHKDAPVCTDCHGEHSILRHTDERSPVSMLNLSENTCGRCHTSIVINDKYGISDTKVANYFDSYHGLALQHKSREVADCASCHGYHLILNSSNPNSTVSKERLVETCGKCHPGVGENVLAAPIHSDVTMRSKAIAAWVPRIYLFLIVVVIGGMLLHNGIIFWGKIKEKFHREKKLLSYTRFTRFEVLLHILLTVSFIMLAISGFALTSPKSWWVTLLSYVYFTEPLRGLIHRISGIVLTGTSILYAIYMVAAKRGRSEFMAFLPKWEELSHAWNFILFHLGKRSEPPKFDRYDYMEKMEFWALVWGVIIMVVTGLILWFPITSFHYLPKWAIDIAELIHYYEAVLATLAIVVWHLFFVMFHPDQYPMSMTWLTGKMTEEELQHHHPKEYERLMASKNKTDENP